MNASSPGPDAVAYLGPEGTFSHVVAQNRHGDQRSLIACPSIKNVFEHVISRAAACGIVPLENSSAGWIYETVDLLIQNARRVHIDEELSLDVKLAFVGERGRTIRKIYSHFAPLKHHAEWLAVHHPQAEQVACASTAHAARLAKADPVGAAFTSRQAAAIYGLEVLEYPVDPHEVNVTSFVQIASDAGSQKSGQKLGLVVRLKNEPGSLLQFLTPFDQARMNLTRIISRPIQGQPAAHQFLVEVDVREDDPRLADVLVQAAERSSSLASLGHFVIQPRMEA